MGRKKDDKRIDVFVTPTQFDAISELAEKHKTSRTKLMKQAAIIVYHLPDNQESPTVTSSGTDKPIKTSSGTVSRVPELESKPFKRGDRVMTTDGLDWVITIARENDCDLTRSVAGRTQARTFVSYAEITRIRE